MSEPHVLRDLTRKLDEDIQKATLLTLQLAESSIEAALLLGRAMEVLAIQSAHHVLGGKRSPSPMLREKGVEQLLIGAVMLSLTEELGSNEILARARHLQKTLGNLS